MKENVTGISEKICSKLHLVFRLLKMSGTSKSALWVIN